MQYLNWMGENYILTIILVAMLSSTIVSIFRSGQIRAIKCPACGYKKVLIEKDDEDA
jgi:hypothetical protein